LPLAKALGRTDAGWTSQQDAAQYLLIMAMVYVPLANVGPDFGAVGGSGDLRAIVGALLTYGLIVAVLMLVVSAATWAIASNSGIWHTAQKAKLGCFVAIGGATLTGAALAWANWLLDIGAHL
jgi:Family of unknown function (DUF6112)